MKKITNTYENIQKADIITHNNKDYVVINADANKDRTNSHLIIKLIK